MSRLQILRDRTRLKGVHRRRVEREGEAELAPAFSPDGLSAQTRTLAVGGFSQLFDTEYESVVIASWMTAGLARIGAPLDLVGAFGKVTEDEIRHVDLVAQLLEGFAVVPSVAALPLPPPVATIVGPDAIEEVLSGLASFFCVGEELSSHIFKAAMELATEPRMRWAVSEIFRDEATHGAFGFETVRELVRLLDPMRKARVAQRVQAAIKAFEARLGGPLDANADRQISEVERALAGLGLLPRAALLGIFYEQLEASVLPRLEDAGLIVDIQVR